MKLFLDTAEFDEVKTGVEWGVIDGVTTNPTLIAKAGQDHETQVKKICGLIGNVSAECVSEKRDDMIVEGRRIAAWHKNVIVKVPLTPDGLGAAKILAGEGIRINVTLCFSVNQALLAAAVGAYIVSPFAGRLDDINEDGMRVVRRHRLRVPAAGDQDEGARGVDPQPDARDAGRARRRRHRHDAVRGAEDALQPPAHRGRSEEVPRGLPQDAGSKAGARPRAGKPEAATKR